MNWYKINVLMLIGFFPVTYVYMLFVSGGESVTLTFSEMTFLEKGLYVWAMGGAVLGSISTAIYAAVVHKARLRLVVAILIFMYFAASIYLIILWLNTKFKDSTSK